MNEQQRQAYDKLLRRHGEVAHRIVTSVDPDQDDIDELEAIRQRLDELEQEWVDRLEEFMDPEPKQ